MIDWQPPFEAFQIGFITVRWYSLFWIMGLLFAYFIVKKLYRLQKIEYSKFEPLLFYCFFGVLIGARLGHCIFYEPEVYLTSLKGWVEMLLPIRILDDGGLKFTGYTGLASHGGTIGLFVALLLYVKKTKINVLRVLDNIAIATPITACCIRLGNLMNSEIIGSQTDVPWAFIFHTNDSLVNGMLVPRHPAQLYEAIAYLIIFIIGAVMYRKFGANTISEGKNPVAPAPRTVGTGFFFGFCLASIFTFRFFVEFIKMDQVDFEQGMILNMGQLLSIPFVIIGVACMIGNKWLRNLSEK